MARFDHHTLTRLAEADEIEMRTPRGDGTPTSRPIWAVVVDGAVYVRSYAGERGAWYRRARADGRAEVRVEGETVAVRAVPAGGGGVGRGHRRGRARRRARGAGRGRRDRRAHRGRVPRKVRPPVAGAHRGDGHAASGRDAPAPRARRWLRSRCSRRTSRRSRSTRSP